MKIHSLGSIIFITIGAAVLMGFYIKQSDNDLVTYIVTVESNNAATPVSFDIVITKDEGETTDFKHLKHQQTPFTMELQNADYLIVVHKTAEKGGATSTVEKRINDKPKASASAEGQVMVLTTQKDGKVTSFGMD